MKGIGGFRGMVVMRLMVKVRDIFDMMFLIIVLDDGRDAIPPASVGRPCRGRGR